MFSFHKSDALPRSRQSSIDFPATGPIASTPASLTGPAADVGHPSQAGMHSPEQHTRFYPGKRNSVFNLRSRSNTATSTTPSLLSLSHPDMAEHEASWQDPSNRSQAENPHQSESFRAGSRRSFFRGKKGRRLSETVGSHMGIGDYREETVADRRTSVLRKGKRRDTQSDNACESRNEFHVYLVADIACSPRPHQSDF